MPMNNNNNIYYLIKGFFGTRVFTSTNRTNTFSKAETKPAWDIQARKVGPFCLQLTKMSSL
jgi:hypothetical protein